VIEELFRKKHQARQKFARLDSEIPKKIFFYGISSPNLFGKFLNGRLKTWDMLFEGPKSD